MESTAKKSKSLRRLIVVLSTVIPIAVAALFGIRIEGADLSFLPPIYAGINGLTAVLLVVALLLVKRRRLKAHERVIKICMFLSVLFLLCYVAYHMTSASTIYGDTSGDGVLQDTERIAISLAGRMTYFVILISHILLSVVVVPLVLYSFLYATEAKRGVYGSPETIGTIDARFTDAYARHRKLAKITWPIWFYVAVSGVVVYLMISPYY